MQGGVVYRPFPTSNHNCASALLWQKGLYIVRFLHQTTTRTALWSDNGVLYIVRFLHQTTTCQLLNAFSMMLYIVRFLHQTTTGVPPLVSCSLVVYRPFPTSNHNRDIQHPDRDQVVYRPFPTSNHNYNEDVNEASVVVYRPFPTSNHNYLAGTSISHMLYIVRFLHQTTTFCS